MSTNDVSTPPLVPRPVLVMGGLAATVIVVAGIKAAHGIVGPALMALVLTIMAHPLRRWLDRRLPTWAATLVCIVVVYLGMAALVIAMVVSTARFATLLPAYQDALTEQLQDLADWAERFGVGQEEIQHVVSSFDPDRLIGLVESILSGAASVLSNLAFILALVLFMTMDGGTFPRLLGSAAKVRPAIVGAIDDFAIGTRRYFAVSTVFGLIVAILDTVALAILDVPAPVLWGLLAFITNYIPNIGFVIGLIPPAVLALLDGGLGMMITVVVIYCLLNVVIQSVIQPKFVGDALGLSTTLTFVSLVFWSWVIGPLGALLAIPLTLLAKAVFVDADPDARWLRPLISNKEDEIEQIGQPEGVA
ncbi:MAG: AI-2E family transporter [Nocardioides sp.]|uniref:AI-2E family transporter n=1 Tax=Nocardioides sp. TaxID=35761 RepID=UPI0039E5F461